MGFFDGYEHLFYSSTSGGYESDLPKKKTYPSFVCHSFQFFEGFELPELKKLLADAEIKGRDTVWVPNKNGQGSGTGLDTWYVKALINHYFKDVDAEVIK